MSKFDLQPTPFNFVFVDAALNGGSYTKYFVDDDKYSFSTLKKEQIAIYKKIQENNFDKKDMPEEAKFESSKEYIELFKNSEPEDWQNELIAMQSEAPFDLRINPIKTDRKTILKEMANVVATPISPFGIRMNSKLNINEVPEFKNGKIEVQDEGSQLISIIVDAKPKEYILDFCAGAGGKTLLMAGMMNNKGRIVACDIFENKLKRAKQRFKRADVQNASTKLLDKNGESWLNRNNNKFDKVLVDAPCSGSGTWRRNPDMKIKPIDMNSITKTQSEILQKAANLVKKDGYIYYATCSLFKEENEQQIEDFLKKNTNFSLEPIVFQEKEYKFFKCSPYKTNTDGFFITKLVKK
jgi:16S rRNA (cytosine967-C5)-methyltransferase